MRDYLVPTQTAKNIPGLGYVGLYQTTTAPSLYAGPTPAMRNLMEEYGYTWRNSVAFTSTGLAGLDSTFPYMSSSHPIDGIAYNDGDDPGIDDLTAPIYIATLTDNFQTYLMFQPPGSDVRWVPLAESVWDTNLKATRPNPGRWATFPPTQSVGPIEFGKSGFDFKSQNTYPSWTNIFTK